MMRSPNIKTTIFCLFVFTLTAAGAAAAQTAPPSATDKPDAPADVIVSMPSAAAKPANAATSVRDIQLGMTIDQVRGKLGKPDVQDDTGLLYTLDKGESVQIGLDADKKVRTVAAIFSADSKSVPTFAEIFGTDAGDAEGDLYKMERYPEAGYWLSYSRTNSKDKPVTVVMMRKIF